MKTIIMHPFSSADAGMFDEPAYAHSAAPWTYLKYVLAQRGYSLETSYRSQRPLSEAEWIVFMNAPQAMDQALSIKGMMRALLGRGTRDDFYGRCVAQGLRDRMALMLWEPEVVYPLNYQRKVHDRFARVFTWMEELLRQGGAYRPIVWPQPPVAAISEAPSFSQRKLLCNFSGNKVSSESNELYSARLEVIRYMETQQPEDFDHYGPGWSADFPSWKGTVESKAAVYPGYRFGLCYENMSAVEGYITEKIFDCLRAGCVPVYWGAPDIAERVDPAAFIDRRQFDSTGQLVNHLSSMPQQKWVQMRQAGQAYLLSPRFQRYLPEAFANMFWEGLT